MIYDIRQTTTYHYASHVAYARHVLRLTPIDRPGQRVHAAALDVEPPPIERREGGDFFGNRMSWIELDQPHDMLSVRVAARVAVKRDALPAADTTPPWENIRAAAFASLDLSPNSPHYLFASRQVSLDPEIRAYAAELLAGPPRAGCRPRADAADQGRFHLRDRRHHGVDRAADVVCAAPRRLPDFAHIMISGMRGLGLPAAYVSGYLRTVPSGKEERLTGADAMHAWVLVWCGQDAGWIGLDPTNAIPAGNDHVVLAIGRDYADVAPIDGVIFASGGQRLEVGVSVTPVSATP
jgi:transglutaminase-like putative cysteine protease